jgi:hypothetical protein
MCLLMLCVPLIVIPSNLPFVCCWCEIVTCCQIENSGYELLRSDFDSDYCRCLKNGMVLNFGKTTFIFFTRKALVFHSTYKLCARFVLTMVEFCSIVLSVSIVTMIHISVGLKMLVLVRYLVLFPLLIFCILVLPIVGFLRTCKGSAKTCSKKFVVKSCL